MVVYRKNRE